MTLGEKSIALDGATQKNVDQWLNGHYDAETKATIQRLLKDNPKEIVDAFYTHLSFGTAGMRGIMGVGTNRMNQYTIRAATQALASYLNQVPAPKNGHAVFIGYDSRHNSEFFAEEAAKVLAANGIKTYLCPELRPTPFVSFGCRYKHCSSAIMITASHNPAEYNGYKVYWNDGGQILPPHDKNIMDAFDAITDVKAVKKLDTLIHPLIEMVTQEIDEAYLKAIEVLQSYPEDNLTHGEKLKVVYTSLHGTGITLMPRAMAEWGFTNLEYVAPQIIPDGAFPTVKKPNPEDPQALTMGIEVLKKSHGDLLVATDPDADRVAVAVSHKGDVQLLNGNQVACLCLEHICKALNDRQALPKKATCIKSIVTTEMYKVIAASYHCECVDVLPGFKYIAEKIREWEKDPQGNIFIFGAEESYGYLLGTQARDKDAILAGVLICEMALQAKLKGKTLIDCMEDLYKKYGVYFEEVQSLNFEESKSGKEQMVSTMDRLRKSPPKQLAGSPVRVLDDYETLTKTELSSGKTAKINMPKSNILIYWLEDGSKVIVRPSGTEPKIKIYCGVVHVLNGQLPKVLQECQQHAAQILKDVGK
ncbi:MAG: phospho-sugar mutase [Parachlamydiaceae bacterium]|nr:phospho-sugar mutase [Parachlamydiaceae bacterium]